MIDYKLVKELKDKGFPQRSEKIESQKSWIDPDGNYFDYASYEDNVYIPTLSELIEACGESFSSLIKKNGGWETNSKYFMKDNIANVHNWIGSSPEEAVSRLWLALQQVNKKVI